ncbi:hypothetical protein Rhal01_02058 [Rubritalea halochordaticola]|uniref:Uncharacterized protein n=1 Tax=Rubritalea halochordaticola TaxID=714537 RepID=A0ABP9V5H6_9BACT
MSLALASGIQAAEVELIRRVEAASEGQAIDLYELLTRAYEYELDKIRIPNQPLMLSGPGLRAGERFFYHEFMGKAVVRCIEEKLISKEQFLLGLYDKRELVRYACISYVYGELAKTYVKPPMRGSEHPLPKLPKREEGTTIYSDPQKYPKVKECLDILVKYVEGHHADMFVGK